MKRYSRDEILRESGASQGELAELEKCGLLVPVRRLVLFGWFGRRDEYYTEGQLAALRRIVRTRRVLERNQTRTC